MKPISKLKTKIIEQTGNKFIAEMSFGNQPEDSTDECVSFRVAVDFPNTNPLILAFQGKCLERALELIYEQIEEIKTLSKQS